MGHGRRRPAEIERASARDERPTAGGHAVWIVLALVIVCIIPYAQAIDHEFVLWDDDAYVTENPHVRDGVTTAGVAWAFTNAHSGNWHPLTWVSHMVDCELFGLAPGGHHVVNLALHILTALLLFLTMRAMTGAEWGSAVVAAMFALHPLRVESVAWVAERKDVLSGLFAMLTFAAYVRYARAPGVGRYLVVAIAFALGLMSKSMLVTLPCVLLLLDGWPLRRFSAAATADRPSPFATRSFGALALEKVPLLTLSLIAAFIATRTQDSGGAVATLESISLGTRILNAIATTGLYLWMTAWPIDLAFFYPHPAFGGGDLAATLYRPAAIAGTLLIAVTVALFVLRRRAPYALTGWLWYLGMLVPVIGIVQIGTQQMADRYTYLPMIGVYVAIVWGFRALVTMRPILRGPAIGFTAILIGLWTIGSAMQVRHWQSSFTLAVRALSVTSDNYMAHNLAGQAFLARDDVGEAIAHFQRTATLAPDFATGHANLGACYARANRLGAAAEQLRRALELEPGNSAALVNLAGVHQARGENERAVAILEGVLRREPFAIDARFSLASALHRMKHADRAADEYRHVLRLSPGHPETLYNLATLELARGRLDNAAHALLKLVRNDPTHASALNALAVVHERQGKPAEAISLLRRALATAPDHAPARRNLDRLTAPPRRVN